MSGFNLTRLPISCQREASPESKFLVGKFPLDACGVVVVVVFAACRRFSYRQVVVVVVKVEVEAQPNELSNQVEPFLYIYIYIQPNFRS